MPQVYLRRDPKVIDDSLLVGLLDVIQIAGAAALGFAGNLLKSGEIHVEVKDFGPFDRCERDLEITLLAHKYPERAADLDDRNAAFAEAIEARLWQKRVTFFTWMLLVDSSFVSVDLRNEGGAIDRERYDAG